MLFDSYGEYLNCLWQNLPAEIRSADKRRWLICRADKKPMSVSKQGSLYSASVTNPGHCLFFEDALRYAQGFSASYDTEYYLGRALFPEDYLTVSDLDRKDPTITEEQKARQDLIIQSFNCYTEFSLSGQGVHVWIGGSFGPGQRRDHVEMYSQERFIICTGFAIPGYNIPILNRQDMLTTMAEQMRGWNGDGAPRGNSGDYVKNNVAPSQSDEDVYNRLQAAENGDKFLILWNGDWKSLPEYATKSQSEADLGLLTFLCFYSDSDDQVMRMFRYSALGKREKAVKNDKYLLRSLGQARVPINGAEPRIDIDVDALLKSATKLNGHALNGHELLDVPPDTPVDDYQITFPPGGAGALAHAIYQNSTNLLPEAAICSALGMLAGICGLSWNINGSGLNHYFVFVGLSGIGKEEMQKGPNVFIDQCKNLEQFIRRMNIQSGQALQKVCGRIQCWVHFQGEIGSLLARYGNSNSNIADQAYGQHLLSFYTVADRNSKGASHVVYAKDVESYEIPWKRFNYSLVGETTPDFYNSIPEEMLSNGLMSRISIIESNNRVPVENLNKIPPPPQLIEWMKHLGDWAIDHQRNNRVIDVQMSEEANELSKAFKKYCTDHLRTVTNNPGKRQIYVRAHLKALRTAGLLAVMDNPHVPVVTAEHWHWVEAHVRHNMNIFLRRFEEGAIGQTDDSRKTQVIAFLRRYLSHGETKEITAEEAQLLKGQIITHSKIYDNTRGLAAFQKHRDGTNKALKQTIDSLIDMGYLHQVLDPKEREKYKIKSKTRAYQILKVT